MLPMLSDVERNSYFKAAIGALEDVERVVDVGSGTGFLSELVRAAHPDAKVTSLEMNPAIAKFSVVECLDRRSSEHRVETPYDVVVAELLDGFPLQEGLVSTVRDMHARGLVKKGLTRFVPGKLIVCAIPIHSTIDFGATVSSSSSSSFSSLSTVDHNRYHCFKGDASAFCAREHKVIELRTYDLANLPPVRADVEFDLPEDDESNALLVFFRLENDDASYDSLNNANSQNHWHPSILPVRGTRSKRVLASFTDDVVVARWIEDAAVTTNKRRKRSMSGEIDARIAYDVSRLADVRRNFAHAARPKKRGETVIVDVGDSSLSSIGYESSSVYSLSLNPLETRIWRRVLLKKKVVFLESVDELTKTLRKAARDGDEALVVSDLEYTRCPHDPRWNLWVWLAQTRFVKALVRTTFEPESVELRCGLVRFTLREKNTTCRLPPSHESIKKVWESQDDEKKWSSEAILERELLEIVDASLYEKSSKDSSGRTTQRRRRRCRRRRRRGADLPRRGRLRRRAQRTRIRLFRRPSLPLCKSTGRRKRRGGSQDV